MSTPQDGSRQPVAIARPPAARLRSLDLLRCVAVLLVIGFHWAGVADPAGASPVLRVLRRYGWTGVDLFFVLSGFLVGGLVLREYQRYGVFRAGSFLIRRGLKIYPAFYVMLGVSLVGARLVGKPVNCGQALHEAFFLQNYLPPLWPHTWSLAVEEHFYLLLSAAAYLWLTRGRRALCLRHLLVAYGGVAAAALAFRVAYVGVNWEAPYHYSHTRLDALLLGVVLTYLYHFHAEQTGEWLRRLRPALVPLGLVCLAPPFVAEQGSWLLSTIGLSVLPLGFAIAMMLLVYSREVTGQPLRWLCGLCCRLGESSYSIYLWHIPLLYVLGRALGGPGLAGAGLGPWLWTYLVLTIGGGIVLARLIEWPVLRLRDRLFPSRSGTLRAAQTPPAPPS